MNILRYGKNYLHKYSDRSIAETQHKPWVAAQAIKWAFLDDYPYPLRNLGTEDEFLIVLDKIWKLTNYNRMPDDFGDPVLFMRSLAFQQFPFQPSLALTNIARQLLLFDSPNSQFYQDGLKRLTGLSVPRFFEMAIFVAGVVLLSKDGILRMSDIVGRDNKINEQEVEAFLNACSVPLADFRGRLQEEGIGKAEIGTPEEYFEFTPLVKFPFIKTLNSRRGDEEIYVCLNRNLLFRWIELAIYDILKRRNHVKFMSKFGRVTFPNYVSELLDGYSAHVLSEKQILEKFGSTGLVVDFLLREEVADIFFEVKGVEAAQSGRMTHRKEKLLSTLQASVLDAVWQANDTRQRISTQEKMSRRAFAVVITFRDHLLGSGNQFFERIAHKELDKLRGKYGDDMIDPENVFFLSIEDLERLVTGLVKSGQSFTDFLSNVAEYERSASISQSKFHFKLHVDSAKFFEYPVKLRQRFTQFEDALKRYFKTR